MSIGAKELAIRRWAMKLGQTTSERAVLYALAIGDGQMKLGQVRVYARGYAPSDREYNVRPALASLQRKGQVKQLANSDWRLV